LRKGNIGQGYSQNMRTLEDTTKQKSLSSTPKIFISHSSADSELAKLILELLRLALSISPTEIRCTSVDGYRLPGGANVDDTLKNEVLNTDILIGLISDIMNS